jgi:hypothetical protein
VDLTVCIFLDAESVIGLAQDKIPQTEHNIKNRFQIHLGTLKQFSVGVQDLSDFFIHSVSFQ